MKKILTTGVFDILHPGHIYYLQQAKKQGDYLVVLVTCDSVATKQKRRPIFNQFDRCAMIKSLKFVDKVIIGSELNNYCQTLNKIQPDILVLGYDQVIDSVELKKCNWNGNIVRVSKNPNKHQSTTNIIQTINNSKIKYQK